MLFPVMCDREVDIFRFLTVGQTKKSILETSVWALNDYTGHFSDQSVNF